MFVLLPIRFHVMFSAGDGETKSVFTEDSESSEFS